VDNYWLTYVESTDIYKISAKFVAILVCLCAGMHIAENMLYLEQFCNIFFAVEKKIILYANYSVYLDLSYIMYNDLQWRNKSNQITSFCLVKKSLMTSTVPIAI
jgi:hypothetical protein